MRNLKIGIFLVLIFLLLLGSGALETYVVQTKNAQEISCCVPFLGIIVAAAGFVLGRARS